MEKERTRIMHIAQAAGGVDRYLKSLFAYLEPDSYENILVCSQDYKKEEYCNLISGFETIEMQRSIGLSDIKAAMQVRKMIKKYEPDIVYAHSSKAGAIARIANVGIKNKCIYNPHGWAFNMQGSKTKQLVYVLLERIMSPLCSSIVCISNAEKTSALNRKICAEKKLKVIFNGVDVHKYEAQKSVAIQRDMLNIPEDAFVVGMVGRLCHQKAPDIFVQTAVKVKSIIPNAYFIMVGDGYLRKEVEELVKMQGMSEAFSITGWVDNPMSYISLFDVALLLSRWEGFGLAIPEYMLCEKPIVATAVDAIPDLITDHENGILVPMDDSEAACNAIEEIFNDRSLREGMIARGRSDVRVKYDVRRTAEQHKILFSEILIRKW